MPGWETTMNENRGRRGLTSPHSPNPSPLSVNGEGRGAKG